MLPPRSVLCAFVALSLGCVREPDLVFPATAGLSSEIEASVGAARSAVSASPRSTDAWMAAGMTFEGSDLFTQARACYENALTLDEPPQGWYRHSVIAWKLGDLAAAVASIRRAIELVPAYAPSHWRLGTYLFDQGDFDGAREAYERATELDAKFVGAWAGLVQVLLATERPAEALTLLADLRKRFPEQAHLAVLTKTALTQAGRIAEAESMRVVWTPLPPGADPWQAELRPYLQKTLMDKARELLGSGAVAEAVRMLEQRLSEGSGDRNACAYLAWGYWLLGRRADARATLDSALKDDARSVLVLAILAEIQEASGELAPALATAERILEVDPDNGAAQAQRGRLLTKLRRSEEAVSALTAALELDSRRPEVWAELGLAHCALQDWNAGQLALERALQDGAQTPGARLALAQAYVQTGREADARELLESSGARTTEEQRLLDALNGGSEKAARAR